MTSSKLTPVEQQAPAYLALKVTDQSTLLKASTYLVEAKKEYKAIKADMDTLLDPLRESIDLIKDKYDPRLKALKGVIDALTLKTTQYQTLATNTRLAQEQAIAERIKAGKGNLSLETATKRMDSLPTVEKKVTTEAGAMSFIAHPMCEVEDISKVPLEYHTVDMVRVRAEMKAGNKLPGIRYWTEQRPRNSRD